MKHLLVGLALVLGVVFVTPAPVAHAWSWKAFLSRIFGDYDDDNKESSSWTWSYSKDSDTTQGSHVPELDPGTAGGALVLLLGGVAYVLSRRKDEEDIA
jgi:hypothetical protein